MKAEGKKGTLLRLGGYLMRYKWHLAGAMALTVGSNLFALIGPLLSGYAVDAIEPGPGRVIFDKVFYYAAWMAGFYVVSSVFSYLLQVLMITISRKVVYQMRKDVFEKLLALPVRYFDVHQGGDIISRISYDIDTVNMSLSEDVVQLLTTVITVSGAFFMMLMISPRLVLVFAFTMPLSMCITRYLTGKTRPLFRARSASLGELNGFAEEMVSGQRTLKAYCQEENTISRFEEKNEEAMQAYYRAEYYGSIVGPMVNFINNLSLSLISVFGAVLYLFGSMSMGNISSFVLYSRKFSGPINEAANIISDLQSSMEAAERVFRLLDEPEEEADVCGAKELVQAEGEVELEHVRFGYNPAKTVIHDLSFHVKPGKMIAIVGPTGAGKTTLINLLMRFYDADEGFIAVDGEKIRGLKRDSLRRAYAMVLQDTWLFTGTIYENLAYGSLEGDTERQEEQVRTAAKEAGIDGFIRRLPDGYRTVLSDEGTNISKGQKQLLTIARAMLLPARMLLLDEATSDVDTRTEMKIQAAMRKLMEDKTCFIIAHRLSTIRNADHILVVNDGDVVQQGTHEQLLHQEGLYRQMYLAQFE
ncbi:MAG TPA: ABC transporter ATP-binding protein/permease [Candidatus Eisenbergiella pullistercoris]|uniref:ABC transporter ATP-binding protein/permease n=1 Tax=Candidatus Eisenbergiella pullistercoris TaxID=2838555 RepID=A0A9D1YNN8_9FIRM|nr:ABC transporter ATP-binding protein/permease [Candidatus Eisenbergiella pullistercoris]